MHLHQYFEEQLEDILEWHDGEQQRNYWEKACHHELEKRAEVDRKWFHLVDEREAVAEVSEGLNVAGAEEGFVPGIVMLDPLPMEQAGICGSQRSVLMETDALCPEQPAGKDDERNDEDKNRGDDVSCDRRREVLQRNFVIDDVVGQDADCSD